MKKGRHTVRKAHILEDRKENIHQYKKTRRQGDMETVIWEDGQAQKQEDRKTEGQKERRTGRKEGTKT